MIIYKITNTVNDRVYVGQTRENETQRWKKHLSAAKRGFNTTICKAIRKYGKEAFTIEILHTCESEEELNLAEIAFIYALNSEVPNGYNLTSGGEGGTPALEVRERMRASHLGKKLSEENKKNIGDALRGKKKTKEHAEKISKGLMGKIISEEHRENLRLSHLGKTQSQEQRDKRVASTKARWAVTPKVHGPTKMAICHPNRKHRAKGLCSSCYKTQYDLENAERSRQRRRLRYEKTGK